MNRISGQLGLNLSSCKKNSALNKGIGRTHYEALFGKCATVGLTSETKIPKEILSTLEKKEDLLRLQDDSLHSTTDSTTHVDTPLVNVLHDD